MKDLLDVMQADKARAEVVAARDFDHYRATATGDPRVFMDVSEGYVTQARLYFDAIRATPNTYMPKPVYLPGRPILSLLEGLRSYGWKYPSAGVRQWAKDEPAPEGWLHVSMRRHPDYKTWHDDSGFFWTWYAPMHPEIQKVWDVRGLGPDYLGGLEWIRRDKSDLLLLNFSKILGTLWLTVEEHSHAAVED